MISVDRFKELAGIVPLQESFDDYDTEDEDDDVRTSRTDKRQSEFERKNASELKKSEEDALKLKGSSTQPKAEPDAEKDEPAKSVETKKSGRGPNADSKSGKIRAWLSSNKDHSRKSFMVFATNELGISVAHANTMYYAMKKKIPEGFMIMHPSLTECALANGNFIGRLDWVGLSDMSDGCDPLMFENEADAYDALRSISMLNCVVTPFNINDLVR